MRSRQKNTIIKVLLCTLIISSCSGTNSENRGEESIIKVDLSRAKKSNSFFDLFNRFDLVQLELNDQSIIKRIEKILFYDERYYILDIMTNKLLCFNSEGKFLFSVVTKGNGPGEATLIRDFEIDDDGIITVLSPYPRKLMKYMASDGTYLSSININDDSGAAKYFKTIDDSNIILCSLTGEHRVYRMNLKTELITELIPQIPGYIPHKTLFNPPASPFFIFQGEIYYRQVYSNKIFRFDSKSQDFKLSKSWDFGKNNFNVIEHMEPDRDNDFYTDLFWSSSMDKVHYFASHVETPDQIITTFIKSGESIMLQHDKNRNTNKIVEIGNSLVYSHYEPIKNEIIFPLMGYLEDSFIKDLSDGLGKDVSYLFTDGVVKDNPILLKCKFN